MKRMICVLATFFVFGMACPAAGHTIWQLGNFDASSAEFALAPDGRDRFVPSGFSDARYLFFCGDQTAADFPYVLPGPTAGWAGSSYWAGPCLVRLPMLLRLDNVVETGHYALTVGLARVEHEEGMFLRVCANGICIDKPLSPDTRKVVFPIASGGLHEGVNHLVLQLFNGQSVEFDALELSGPEATAVVPIGDLPVVELEMADYELDVDGRRVQPLLLRSFAREAATLDVRIGDEVVRKRIGPGEGLLELPVHGAREGQRIEVEVTSAARRVAASAFRRTRHALRRAVDYVNQFAGSSGSRWMIGPGPWMPFGMVKIMPDNEDAHWKAGYEYGVENIMGFSHIHEWTMAGLLTMPAVGPLQLQPGTERDPDAGYRSRIDKSTEQARVGYYGVELTDYDIRAELTATTRASLQRYTFRRPDDARVLVDLFFPAEYAWTLRDLCVRRISDTEIEGWTWNDCRSTGYHGVQDYRLHFVMQFDRPFRAMNGWLRDSVRRDVVRLSPAEFGAMPGDVGDAGFWLDFDLEPGAQVCVRTGISLVGMDNARLNLTEELVRPFGWDFEAVVENQRAVWERLFDRVRITTDDRRQKEKFYTNLYRAISPRTIWNDVDGRWRDMNGDIARIDRAGRNVFGGDSAWGMHWTLGPFYNLLYPEYMADWIHTYEAFYRRGGWLPVGNPGMRYFRVMVGNPALPLIVSGYQHGIRDFDTALMAEAILHQQTAVMENYPGGGQVGNESYPDYITKGYVPLYDDSWRSDSPHYQSYVSNTMEYAFQDYCAAQYFRALGRERDCAYFMRRAGSWRNIYDPETRYVRPRYPDGRWVENTDPYRAPGFCEGSAWQFTWYVPHEPERLRDTMGERLFIDRLNEGFATSERVNFNALGDNMTAYPVNHGNETNMQAAYLFNFTSEPWHTQRWVRAIQERYYGLGPRDAYPGDEDQGQMSSWYVMSCLGLFTMDGGCGADPQWTLGSPRFERVEIRLDDRYHSGRRLVIEAPGASAENCYVRAVYFDGERLCEPFISWSRLREGGVLRFEMGAEPCKTAFVDM